LQLILDRSPSQRFICMSEWVRVVRSGAEWCAMICSVWVARRIGARTKANKSLEIYFSCLLAVCVMQIFRQFPDKSLIPLWPISTNLIRPETKDSGNELALIRTISRLSIFRISSAPSRYLFNPSCILFSLLYMFSFYYAALRARHA